LANPIPHNLQAINTEKQCKYRELAFEIRQQWQVDKIVVIPLALSATCVIPTALNQSLTTLNSPPPLLSQVQKVTVLNTCSIVKKFLNDKVQLHDEEADNP
jgi:hypothetical protein